VCVRARARKSMNRRIDIHCHLIPGVDDGCQTVQESVACARALVAAGYTHAFCTPHIWPNLVNNTIQNITRWVQGLQVRFDEQNVPLRLSSGGEISLRPDIVTAIPGDQLVTYAMKRKYVLIDLWADRLPAHFEPSIRWMQSLRLTVILAHPERMRAVQDKPELADEFARMGVLLQGNLQCFSDPVGSYTRVTAERYLREDRYFALGSDTHGLDSIEKRLAGLKRVESIASSQTLDRLLRINPTKLME
jgi:protein-tyrosine phosphatase